jgi:hypothetical protein
VNFAAKAILMTRLISYRQTDEFKYRQLTPVFRVLPSVKQKPPRKKIVPEKEKKELPLFYDRPIFRAREHDPL